MKESIQKTKLSVAIVAAVLCTILVPAAPAAAQQSQTDWYVNDNPSLFGPDKWFYPGVRGEGYGSNNYVYPLAVGGRSSATNWVHWYMGNRIGRQQISGYISKKSDTISEVPGIPSGVAYDASRSVYGLAVWERVSGATYYQVNLWNSATSRVMRGVGCCQYTINQAQGITHFRVRAVNNAGEGEWSTWIQTTAGTPEILEHSGLNVEVASPSRTRTVTEVFRVLPTSASVKATEHHTNFAAWITGSGGSRTLNVRVNSHTRARTYPVKITATSGSSTTSKTVEIRVKPRPITWLATGDSYSSGLGAPGAEGKCWQNKEHAPGPQAANKLRRAGWDIRAETFTACAGTETVHLFNPSKSTPGEVSLWNWHINLNGPEKVDIITMSFGGNDAKFKNVLKMCSFLRPDKGLRCPKEDHITEDMDEAIENLKRTIDDATKKLTPRGHLYVVGYPRLFEKDLDWWRPECHSVNRWDVDMLNRRAEYFNEEMKRMVENMPYTFVHYVEILPTFHEWELCGRGPTYINGINTGFAGNPWNPAKFHPSSHGYKAIVELLTDKIIMTFRNPPMYDY